MKKRYSLNDRMDYYRKKVKAEEENFRKHGKNGVNFSRYNYANAYLLAVRRGFSPNHDKLSPVEQKAEKAAVAALERSRKFKF